MKRFIPEKAALARCEFAAATLLTLFLIFLHLRLLVHAGPLWRDKINSLYVAHTQTVHDFTAARSYSIPFRPFSPPFCGFGSLLVSTTGTSKLLACFEATLLKPNGWR